MACRIVGMAVLLTLLSVLGCSSEVPPADLTTVDGPSTSTTPALLPPGSREVVLVLPSRPNAPTEMDAWEAAFRAEGRRSKAVVSVSRASLAEDDRPERQAEAIREAARRSAALIVVAGQGIQPALDEAAKLGTPMVALDSTIVANGKPLPIVTYPSTEETARKLVEATIEAAKVVGFPPNGPAVVLHHQPKDARTDARADALEAALRAAKVDVLPRVVFDGGAIEAKKALLPFLIDKPRLAMAFSSDESAMPALIEQRRLRVTTDRFVIAGYIEDRKILLQVSFGQLAAIVDLNVTALIPAALRVALDLAAGKPVPDRTVVNQPMSRFSGEDMTDRVPKPPTIPEERPVPKLNPDKFRRPKPTTLSNEFSTDPKKDEKPK